MTLISTTRRRFVSAAILSALLFFVVLETLALLMTGGVFEYPLDDVYIHLSMAEGIWAGGYGVNPGEYSSAASSALYPLLLVPFASPEIQRFMPLLWNVVGLVASAWLWAELLLAGGYGHQRLSAIGLILAIAGPLALLMSSTAFLGMEHTLHAATSLAIVLGLLRHFQGATPWALLFAGILFSPLLRYEGLALALLACGVLFIGGQKRRAMLGFALALVPLAGFSIFLMSLGLDPLPNSIMAKQLTTANADLGTVQNIIWKFRYNISTGGGSIVFGFVLASLAAMALSADIRHGPLRRFAFVLIIAGIGHLFLGQIGWLNRYEHYILVTVAGGFLVLLAAFAGRISALIIAAVAVVALLIPAVVYLPEVIKYFPVNARAIHTQQGQMARFAKQHLKAPVAVNDIGWLTWNNENYVLDLGGLASAEALKLRLGASEPGWAGPLADAHQVPVAMIYDAWIGEAVGSDWIKLGEFILRDRVGFLGGDTVTFYATSPAAVKPAIAALNSWVLTLDPLTYFDFAELTE
ncbi:MAG: hypothetical protein ACU0C9_05445 [Paracoccaceae bacterium]